MSDYTVSERLDCSGLLCPMPVVKTKKAMKALQAGEVLEMISTDPGSMPDMHAWAMQTGNELLEASDQGDNVFRFLIKKN